MFDQATGHHNLAESTHKINCDRRESRLDFRSSLITKHPEELLTKLVQVEKADGEFGVVFIEAAMGGNHTFVRGYEEGEKIKHKKK